MQYSYTIWVICLHLLQFLCSKLKRLKGTVSSQMAIRHVQRDFCNCWLASFTCLRTVQFLITCSSVSAYILQAIENWTVGRPGDEANCWYLSRKCLMQLVWTGLADYASQHALWAQEDKDSETYTTSSLSIPADPRASAGLLCHVYKWWNTKQH